jgi:hypothetical protein
VIKETILWHFELGDGTIVIIVSPTIKKAYEILNKSNKMMSRFVGCIRAPSYIKTILQI